VPPNLGIRINGQPLLSNSEKVKVSVDGEGGEGVGCIKGKERSCFHKGIRMTGSVHDSVQRGCKFSVMLTSFGKVVPLTPGSPLRDCPDSFISCKIF
jgi:hypothetical protein